ncbi:NAD-dependent DNA ligase subunit B [Vibrio phage VCPH]|nr:NAD-dependent DNA ligase subunit B [Vibrio phage VCPH]
MFIPSNCPSCDSTLERVKDQLFCRNASCPAQNSKVVEGFCKKMKIKGFGAKTIEKLELSAISDLYELDQNTLYSQLGEKTASKLLAEIDAKRQVEFVDFLGSLGIPLIGNAASKKIANVVQDWASLEDAVFNNADLGIGEKASQNLYNWMNSEIGMETMAIPIEFKESVKQVSSPVVTEQRGTVVITGKLTDFKNRAEAASFLETKGFDVKGSVSSKTNYLIVEDGSTSSKTTKADSLGIPILSIKELLNIFGE